MRMHSYGKCSPNVVVGALTVFTLIVLYNYWGISTLNRDLVLKLRGLEQQIISMSNANEKFERDVLGLQEDRSRLQKTLQHEEREEKNCREVISAKEKEVKMLQNDLEISRRETQNSKDEYTQHEAKLTEKMKEIGTLKEKITSLEAQIAEKSGLVDKLNAELTDAHERQSNLQSPGSKSSSSKSTAASARASPVEQPQEQVMQGEEPKLLNDPAVPYPNGWMDPSFSKQLRKPNIRISEVDVGVKGIRGHGSPVILFDDPKTPRKTARYSVLDPPKSNRNLLKKVAGDFDTQDLARDGVKKPQPLRQPNSYGGGEDPESVKYEPGNFGVGVLPVPENKPPSGRDNADQMQQPVDGGNLDAAEDDLAMRQFKEDAALQDDQSPDGALPPKEMGVGPAPARKPDIPQANSGQDVREEAHLKSNDI